MEQKLQNRTALVTGAGRRIGRGIALELAAAGADVVVHYRRSRDQAEQAAEEIRRLGRRAWCVCADLSDPHEAAGLMAEAVASAGPVSILVNNASSFPSDTIVEATCESILQSVQVHALAPLVLARGLAGQNLPAGDVVNLLDSRVEDYDRLHASYHLGKRMLLTITRMLALELAPRVKVNAVAPGLVLPPEGKDESYLAGLAHTNPLGRVGSVEAVASAARQLVESDFITGQIIYVDGGRHMKGCVYG
jgi:pteridine reductase